MIIQTVWLECDLCEWEGTGQPDVYDAVHWWRQIGGTCDDDGHLAICEDCQVEE